MKKTLLLTGLLTTLASTAALAHHPAADRVDPEIYAMIDENVADTPHADMTFDDMGRDLTETDAAMDAREEMSANANESRESLVDNAGMRMEAATDREINMETEVAETIGLLDDVINGLSE